MAGLGTYRDPAYEYRMNFLLVQMTEDFRSSYEEILEDLSGHEGLEAEMLDRTSELWMTYS